MLKETSKGMYKVEVLPSGKKRVTGGKRLKSSGQYTAQFGRRVAKLLLKHRVKVSWLKIETTHINVYRIYIYNSVKHRHSHSNTMCLCVSNLFEIGISCHTLSTCCPVQGCCQEVVPRRAPTAGHSSQRWLWFLACWVWVSQKESKKNNPYTVNLLLLDLGSKTCWLRFLQTWCLADLWHILAPSQEAISSGKMFLSRSISFSWVDYKSHILDFLGGQRSGRTNPATWPWESWPDVVKSSSAPLKGLVAPSKLQRGRSAASSANITMCSFHVLARRAFWVEGYWIRSSNKLCMTVLVGNTMAFVRPSY